ncbi:MAG TPA: hypothetical protein VKE98_22740 [Gemmataceae bacterium]|nr:hypothetical protein [Gemmataceae bacterium]
MKWAVVLLSACGLAGAVVVGQPEEKANSTVTAWVQVLAKNIADRHDTVRESARAALVSVGKPALPTLKQIAAGKDDAAADAARRLIARIQADDSPPVVKPIKDSDPVPVKKPEKARPDKGERKGFGGIKGFPLPGSLAKNFGQSRPDPVTSALKNVKLSKEQQTKVDGIRKSYDKKTKEQRQKFLEEQKKLHDGMLNDVKGALTPDQLKQFDEAIKKGPGRAAPGKGRKGGIDLSSQFLPRIESLLRTCRDAGRKQ